MRSSLAARAARVASPLSSRLEIDGFYLRTWLKSTYPQQHPPSPLLASLLLRLPQSLGVDRAPMIKFNIRHAMYPFSTHRHSPGRTPFSPFPRSITVSCSFCPNWISVQHHLIENTKAFGISDECVHDCSEVSR